MYKRGGSLLSPQEPHHVLLRGEQRVKGSLCLFTGPLGLGYTYDPQDRGGSRRHL